MPAIDELHDDILQKIPDGSPVVMINLIKFKEQSDDGDGSGWDAYTRYSKGITPTLKKVGGVVNWAGNAKGAAFGPPYWGDWDFIAKVTYPSIEAFRNLITSPEYEAANHHRLNGTERHVIIATEEAFVPWAQQ